MAETIRILVVDDHHVVRQGFVALLKTVPDLQVIAEGSDGAEAIELYRRSRQAGLTPRSSVDCLIAACALRHGLTVVHRDRDFSDLARISSLEARDILRR